MQFNLKSNRRPTLRKVIEKYAFLPIIHQGTFFWLSKVKIEKSFNGINMQIINIQRL